ncbi:hypothetical protein UAY_01972 [Enterococcus moraviensis ATCC BAA-383]|uniref:Uncharacterized protein n=1 Tax=Enterococcus moraviensis ATCC BAA-383 TaxID=1158609 RepID=R2SVC5_9ENTE|nr:hypothetical protein [Enterococcus moraviensis]EOH99195.1 hypothetical protein UAY_01972 [Enterococcus moraviensis ATCC BAA-383]EOT72122.1 hypothetical protein I586_01930 [Enterococcus moraviensis ATCC BAA-383]OJG67446.1 hypothetical protein RV09_GL002662 [Enterococcus moraviensis]
MNNRELQRKFSEQSNIDNSTFDAMNTNQTRFSNGQGKTVLPLERDRSSASDFYFVNGIVYVTGVAFAIMLFLFVIPLFESLVPAVFYKGAMFLLCALLSCTLMGYLWIYIGKKLVKKRRR